MAVTRIREGLVYQPLCCVATTLPDPLVVEFPRLMVLGAFELPSLGATSEEAQEFTASMAALGLSQIILGLTQDSDHTPGMIFLSEQWQPDLVG